MRSSLTREELANIFKLPPDAVEALIASGRLLCHMRDGETRIPLDQLEAFFREGLIAVFRTEAALQQDAGCDLPSPQPQIEPAISAEEAEEQEPELVTEAEPVVEPMPAVVGAPPATARPLAIPAFPSFLSREREEAARERSANMPESRVAERYVPRRQIDGIFGDVKFTILQMSATGLRIRHAEPLLPGDEGKLTFALLNEKRSFAVKARVVWTSVARFASDHDRTVSISGLRLTEHQDRMVSAIALLRSSHALQPERRAGIRIDDDPTTLIDGVSDDDVALVLKAATKFASDPVEASRWYGRARFALSDEEVRLQAPRKAREREEVLGIWEYLDRQVSIQKITGVLLWMRKTRRAEA